MNSTTSIQLRPQPHITGTAAMSATNGIVTNSQSAIRTPMGCLPTVRGLGAGPAGWVAAGSTTAVDICTSVEPEWLRLRYRSLGVEHREWRRRDRRLTHGSWPPPETRTLNLDGATR